MCQSYRNQYRPDHDATTTMLYSWYNIKVWQPHIYSPKHTCCHCGQIVQSLSHLCIKSLSRRYLVDCSSSFYIIQGLSLSCFWFVLEHSAWTLSDPSRVVIHPKNVYWHLTVWTDAFLTSCLETALRDLLSLCESNAFLCYQRETVVISHDHEWEVKPWLCQVQKYCRTFSTPYWKF